MFVCLVLYILWYLSYFIMGVCVSESIWMNVCVYVCVSCPVDIVVLILFHYGCVSLRASVWKFVCLVLYILSCFLCYFITGVCQWEHLYDGRWFSSGTPVSSTIKIYSHDTAEILLKVALNTIKPNSSVHIQGDILDRNNSQVLRYIWPNIVT
jgi:hypothetical protein